MNAGSVCVRIVCAVCGFAAVAVAQEMQATGALGAKLVTKNCQRCHRLDRTALSGRSVDQWRDTIERMCGHLARLHKNPPSADARERMAAYLAGSR